MTETDALFVGADNTTGRLDLDRIAKIMSKHVDGFTILPARGYWHGSPEPSAEIIVSAEPAQITAAVADLASELDQQAIGRQVQAPITFTQGEQS
jgi:hypothetical protein